jgi:hypothetical protein
LTLQADAQAAMLAARIPQPIADQVCDWVLTRPDREVEHISAYDWAAQLAEQYPGVTAAVVLRALLIAADHHLLELFWDLRCPHCRGGTRSRSLIEVRSQQDCLSCNVAYDAAFDQDIAVTFTPAAQRAGVGPVGPLCWRSRQDPACGLATACGAGGRAASGSA